RSCALSRHHWSSPRATLSCRGDRSYYSVMPWRAKCYECGQEAGITRPVFETFSSFAVVVEGGRYDLQSATAFYATHSRSTTDTRPCSGVGKAVPKHQIREAYSTTPSEDPPDLDPR